MGLKCIRFNYEPIYFSKFELITFEIEDAASTLLSHKIFETFCDIYFNNL